MASLLENLEELDRTKYLVEQTTAGNRVRATEPGGSLDYSRGSRFPDGPSDPGAG